MNHTKSISGTVVYKNIGLGFWGIESANGGKWLPINMPESLKQEGKKVTIRVKELEEDITTFMWGTPVRIV